MADIEVAPTARSGAPARTQYYRRETGRELAGGSGVLGRCRRRDVRGGPAVLAGSPPFSANGAPLEANRMSCGFQESVHL